MQACSFMPTALGEVSVPLLDLTHSANLAFMHSCIHQTGPCNLATFWYVPLLEVLLFEFHNMESNLLAHDPLTDESQQVNNTFDKRKKKALQDQEEIFKNSRKSQVLRGESLFKLEEGQTIVCDRVTLMDLRSICKSIGFL